MAAAMMVADEEIGSSDLINLAGGILAWDGGMTADYPNVQVFNWQAAPSEMLMTAMNLEKGALNFYTHVGDKFSEQPWVEIFSNLAKAEMGHARIVYKFWRQIETGGDEFDVIFEGLTGEVLEGGMKFSEAIESLTKIQGRVCLRLIEIALKIEFAAFDLYRAMADRVSALDAQEAFISLAQAEKAHMRALTRALDKCDV